MRNPGQGRVALVTPLVWRSAVRQGGRTDPETSARDSATPFSEPVSPLAESFLGSLHPDLMSHVPERRPGSACGPIPAEPSP
jgi:hypothetical protein